jgi:hypothetical protein
MLTLRLNPDRLREEARHLRHVMHELDHVRWCVNRSWSRLGRGESNVLAAAGVDLGYDDVVSSLRHRADALCRFAWILEATASRVEVADERAAGDFNFF